MRTTITLDKDVAQRVREATTRMGRSFKSVVNEALRAGLTQLDKPKPAKPFKVKAIKMRSRQGIDLNNIHELIAQIEGEDR